MKVNTDILHNYFHISEGRDSYPLVARLPNISTEVPILLVAVVASYHCSKML